MKNLIRKILKEEIEGTIPTVIFVGGCDSSPKSCKKDGKVILGFKPLSEQTQLLKSGLGDKFNVISFGHYDYNKALTEIDKYTNPYVVLFSAGCSKSNKFSSRLKTNGDLNKMYIVEPYSCTSGTESNVLAAVNDGVPKKNVLGGKTDCTGKNVAGTIDSNSTHWSALYSVGKTIKNSYVEPVEDKGGVFNDYEYDDPYRYSDTLHPDNYRLNEQEEDKEVDPFDDTLFPPKFMEKMMVKMDEDPDFFMKEILPSMGFSTNQEANVVYNYLAIYNRKAYYVPVHFDAEELSNLFYDDRDYDIQHMAKKYFQQDYDYHYDYDCYGFESYYFDMVDKVNVDWMREKYFEGFDGDRDEVYNKEGFMEFVEEEFGDEIGCAMADAQQSADVDALHMDFNDSVLDYLSDFDGKLEYPVLDEETGARGYSLEFFGRREIGDVIISELFKETLYDHIHSGYSTLPEIFSDVLNVEREEENYYDNVLLPEEKIQINTDRHFRYGGYGDVDPTYFNETLHDKLTWH